MVNSGSARTYPVFTFTGPGRIYSLINFTTGDEIYFSLLLLSVETAVLDLKAKTFTSSFRGNIIHTITPNSDLAVFHLLPGQNDISIFLDNASATAFMSWDELHWSADGGVEVDDD
jgi:hypothetical protein